MNNDAEFHSFCDALRYTVCFSVVALGVAFMVGILCHGKKCHRPVRLLACYCAAFLICAADCRLPHSSSAMAAFFAS